MILPVNAAKLHRWKQRLLLFSLKKTGKLNCKLLWNNFFTWKLQKKLSGTKILQKVSVHSSPVRFSCSMLKSGWLDSVSIKYLIISFWNGREKTSMIPSDISCDILLSFCCGISSIPVCLGNKITTIKLSCQLYWSRIVHDVLVRRFYWC